jgi:hypothetical protein
MKNVNISISIIPHIHNSSSPTTPETPTPNTTPTTDKPTPTHHPFTIGQNVWSTTYPTHQQQVGFGTIQKLFDTSDGPAFQFYDEINGGFRLSLIKDIIHKPNGRMINQFAKAQFDLNNPKKDKDKKK